MKSDSEVTAMTNAVHYKLPVYPDLQELRAVIGFGDHLRISTRT